MLEEEGKTKKEMSQKVAVEEENAKVQTFERSQEEVLHPKDEVFEVERKKKKEVLEET